MFERKLNALQIKVSLAEISPSVWRRLIVPAIWHLGELHLAIQAAFNWWNYHLHEFRIGGLRYGDPIILEEGSFEDDARVFDEREVRLRDFSREDGISFSYIYDFGDNWVHTVEIEKHVSLDVEPRIAACVAGERARPPEDVGGVSGYENFLAIIGDPTNDEHNDTKHWCGGHFDRDWFDLTMTDKDVRNALRANVRRRMHQPRPKPTHTPHQMN
jgi:hypothetical protein